MPSGLVTGLGFQRVGMRPVLMTHAPAYRMSTPICQRRLGRLLAFEPDPLVLGDAVRVEVSFEARELSTVRNLSRGRRSGPSCRAGSAHPNQTPSRRASGPSIWEMSDDF